MKSRAALAAKFLSLTYVPVSALHLLLAFARTGDTYMLKFLITQPAFWLTLVGSIYVGIRITERDAIAWWVGIVGAAVLLYLRLSYVAVAVREGFVFLPLGVTLLWLAAFVACLLAVKLSSEKPRAA